MIDRLERRAGQALLGAAFMKLGFDAAVDPGPRVDQAAAHGLPNAELVVRAWNSQADDLWGLRSTETVGQHLINLDIGLPTDRLRPLVRGALNGAADGEHEKEMRVEAINRRGRTVSLVVSASPLRLRDSGPTGAIVLMDQVGAPEPSPPS